VTGCRRSRWGDQVFGLSPDTYGAHAEYICLPEDGPIATKPANMSHDEAAALCEGHWYAWTNLREAGLREGTAILIYGASGAIGTAAVQLAKHLGAEVTAVCNTKNLALVKSLGADEVIDYTKTISRAAARPMTSSSTRSERRRSSAARNC